MKIKASNDIGYDLAYIIEDLCEAGIAFTVDNNGTDWVLTIPDTGIQYVEKHLGTATYEKSQYKVVS